jgi:hypothetical protein
MIPISLTQAHWIGQLNNNEHNIFLIESPADYEEVRP